MQTPNCSGITTRPQPRSKWYSIVVLSFAGCVVSMWGCGGPTREQCDAACTKTVRILAENIQGESNEKIDAAVAVAIQQKEPCVATCMEQDKSYVACLADADSLKRIRECIAVR